MPNNTPILQPDELPESHAIFAALRDALAHLYTDPQNARVVADDAGLNTKQVAFSARAQTNWHHILLEAVRQNRLDIVLSIALTTYPDNPRLKQAYTQYTLFTKQGGEITPPDHLAINKPVTIVETEGGAYVARNVSTEQGDFVGRDNQIAGEEVSGNKIEGDQIDARESRGFINRPSGPVTQHYGNTVHIGSFNISKPLAWAVLVLIVISVGFIGYIALNTGSIRTAVTAPTAAATPIVPTATLTTTPLPTATPLAFATEAPGETLIVIATFLVTEGNRDTLAHREIRNKIQEEAQKVGESNLHVALEPTILASDQQEQAKALGQQYQASMVIWGDDTGARMTVNFLNIRQPDFDASTVTISETERTQIANPQAYSQFVIDDLPRQLTFLSLFALGQSYYINQDYPHAIEAIETAIASLQENVEPPGLVEAFYRLGWLYQTQTPKNLGKAIANYDKAIQLDPNNAFAYNNRGIVRSDQGKLDEAIADYDKAIQLNIDDALAYNNRGIARFRQGKLDGAIADFEKTIQLDPDFAEAYNNRGRARDAQGKLDEAIIDYDKAIQLTPDLAEAYNNRGLVRSDQGKLDEAIADYDKAIQLDPDFAEAYNNRGIVRGAQGKLDEAIIDYDKAIQLTPDLAEAYNNRGNARSSQGKLDEAIADFDKAIQLNPCYAEAYYNRGIAQKTQGKLDEAIADYDKAIQLNPDLAKAYYNRGIARGAQGKLDEAIADFDKAIQINPNYTDAFGLRGLTYRMLGEPKKALADFRRNLELRPDSDLPELVKQWINEIEAELAKPK